MTQPKARCITCLQVIQSHDTHNHQRPKYCDNPECRETWKSHPICGRCRLPLELEGSSAKRFHEECAQGCNACGATLKIRGDIKIWVNQQRKNPLQDVYCSKECRDWAWEDQPMPICRVCNEPTSFNTSPAAALRNPPAIHPQCSNRKKRQSRKEDFDDMFLWTSIWGALTIQRNDYLRQYDQPVPQFPFPDDLDMEYLESTIKHGDERERWTSRPYRRPTWHGENYYTYEDEFVIPKLLPVPLPVTPDVILLHPNQPNPDDPAVVDSYVSNPAYATLYHNIIPFKMTEEEDWEIMSEFGEKYGK